MFRTKQLRTQKPSIDEKYKTFLNSNGEPKDPASNSLNLFDELNSEDEAWFTIAKIYLNQNVKDTV